MVLLTFIITAIFLILHVKYGIENVLNIYNWYYVITGKYKNFIYQQYQKLFDENKEEETRFKIASCPECYLNNQMKCCNCNFSEVILTNKKCKYGKF